MDELAGDPEVADQAKFLINVADDAQQADSQEFMSDNGVTKSTGGFGKVPDFFKQSHLPHKAMVKADGTLAANYRFRQVDGESGDRVGTKEDFILMKSGTQTERDRDTRKRQKSTSCECL
eukprot:gnl/TRDRNA2_/TRDRNA2_89984_c0_seq1.p1 gnl/TRDRNA2_/TRDRNA2_89984_c0~~gnl/TRDRNA2_/TRDRNA2_89984_c0_seq1.p1  ORF type:complete len:120 (+),score=26.36 gnl/TRDRNA2_/TRDRNA2_89984_c0_seq1:63-422(+)